VRNKTTTRDKARQRFFFRSQLVRPLHNPCRTGLTLGGPGQRWLLYCYISATVRPISTKFCMLTHIGPPNLPKYSQNPFKKKSKMADGRHFEKTLNTISLQPFVMKFGMMMHLSHPKLTENQELKNFKIQDGGQRPS